MYTQLSLMYALKIKNNIVTTSYSMYFAYEYFVVYDGKMFKNHHTYKILCKIIINRNIEYVHTLYLKL